MQIFVHVWAGFGLLLFASTWKLWTPQAEFPQIPFVEILVDVPGWVDWFALAGLGLGLTLCLFVRIRSISKASIWLFVVAASVLILLNQHRLQPWAFQFVAFAIIMATAKPKTAFAWMRWIVISIYIYSAISKFDYQFIHTVGDQMLMSLADRLWLEPQDWPERIRHWIVFAFPLAELLIGLGLAMLRFRAIAAVAAVMMHAALLGSLIGQVDGSGVLIWNLFFIVQAIFLFMTEPLPQAMFANEIKRRSGRKPADQTPLENQSSQDFPLEFVATAASLIVLLFPITQPFGICDHWPAWQVYAPCSSRAKFVTYADSKGEDWSDIPAWSNRVLRVPVYPQARFQFAVAVAAQEKFPAAKDLPIQVSRQSDRWTGVRESESLTGDQVQMQAERYWLNTKARSLFHVVR